MFEPNISDLEAFSNHVNLFIDDPQCVGNEKGKKRLPNETEKSNIFIVKNRIMFGALFKSEFTYHFPSLKSNQFPSDNTFCCWLNDWSNDWHISICDENFSLSRTLSGIVSLLMHNCDSNWHIVCWWWRHVSSAKRNLTRKFN